jgi:hypothetical protein
MPTLHVILRVYSKIRFFSMQLLLLGQAESGKSTLQKQFQLMYKPASLDDERSSWRTVIYFNVVRSIKHILTTLEAWDDTFDELDDSNSATSNSPASSGHASPDRSIQAVSSSTVSDQLPIPTMETLKYQIANLRRRLSPLVAADTELADHLTGGVSVSGSGKGGVFVRSGWQARSIENGLTKKRADKNFVKGKDTASVEDRMIEDIGRMLEASKTYIQELWEHPTVKALVTKRKLRLEEWSELCVNLFPSPHS